MGEYTRIPLLLGYIPYLAIACYCFGASLLYSLTPLLLLVVMDIWYSLQLQADMDIPYEPPTNVMAANGRAKLRKAMPPKTGLRYLVVGCGGVGNRMMELLQQRGEEHVYGMDILPHDKNKSCLDEAHQIIGNVTNLESCQEAIQKVQPDVVFHTAAIISYSHKHESQWPKSYQVNVKGVLNMLEASSSYNGNKVKAFILTSSSTVGLNRTNHVDKICMGDETDFPPETESPWSWYTRSKAMAEIEALQYIQQSQHENAPVAFGIIRPASHIFHQRDALVMEKAMREYKAPAIGFERNMLDWVYCDNVVLGHLLLEKALLEGNCKGETFLITNREPMTGVEMFRRIKHFYKRGARNSFVYYKMPTVLIWTLAQISDLLLKLGKPVPTDLALLTPTTLDFCRVQFIFKDDKAKNMLGYNPAFTVNEGIMQMIQDQQAIFRQELISKMKKNE